MDKNPAISCQLSVLPSVQENTVEQPALTDPLRFPDDELIAGSLGKAMVTFEKWRKALAERDAEIEWRYYKDGKAWLGKVQGKKAALCWPHSISRSGTEDSVCGKTEHD